MAAVAPVSTVASQPFVSRIVNGTPRSDCAGPVLRGRRRVRRISIPVLRNGSVGQTTTFPAFTDGGGARHGSNNSLPLMQRNASRRSAASEVLKHDPRTVRVIRIVGTPPTVNPAITTTRVEVAAALGRRAVRGTQAMTSALPADAERGLPTRASPSLSTATQNPVVGHAIAFR